VTKFSIGCLNFHYLTARNSIGLKASRELLRLVKSWIVGYSYALYQNWMIQRSAIKLKTHSFSRNKVNYPN